MNAYPNLQLALARRGITQEQAAELLGIHPHTFSNKIRGESRFAVEEALTLYEAYFAGRHINFRWLFAHAKPKRRDK